jgi:site-specific DNA recombinase
MPLINKRAAIYARVSTEKQEKEKTIESQLADLREACKRDGVKIVKEYIDNGFSGATLARPALDRLRDDASKGIFNVVYIHSPDRLARKYVYQAIVVEELKKKGIEMVFLNKPLTDSPEDQLLLGVQGVIAEYEKAKFAERSRRGRLYKAKMGRIVGNIAPFGYRYLKDEQRNGCYVIDEDEARIVKLIFDLYIKLGSVRAVAKELTRMGIKPRQGVHWRQSTLHRILRNETYIGTTYYNKTCSIEPAKSKKYVRRPKSSHKFREKVEWIPIKVPPILDEETFKTVQELLKRNSKIHIRSSRKYLLSGLIECGYCGANYSGDICHGYRFYRCNNRHRRFPLSRNCNARMISADKIENSIWNAIVQAVMKPHVLIPYTLGLTSNVKKLKENLEEERLKLKQEKNALEIKKDRIIELYTDGTITKEQLTHKMEEYKGKEGEIEEKLKDVEAKLNQIIFRPIVIRDILNFCKKARERLENLNEEEKQALLKLLIEKIIFYSHERRAIIKGHIPLNQKDTMDYAGITSKTSLNHGQYPNNWLKFELELKI